MTTQAQATAQAQIEEGTEPDLAGEVNGAPAVLADDAAVNHTAVNDTADEDATLDIPAYPWVLPPNPLPGPDNHPFFAALNLPIPVQDLPSTSPPHPTSTGSAVAAAISSLDLNSATPTNPARTPPPTSAVPLPVPSGPATISPSDQLTAAPSAQASAPPDRALAPPAQTTTPTTQTAKVPPVQPAPAPLPTLRPASAAPTPPSAPGADASPASRIHVRVDSMTGTSGDKTLHGTIWALRDRDAGRRRNQWAIDIG